MALGCGSLVALYRIATSTCRVVVLWALFHPRNHLLQNLRELQEIRLAAQENHVQRVLLGQQVHVVGL